MKKKFNFLVVIFIVVLAMALVLVACTNNGNNNTGDDNNPDAGNQPSPTDKTYNITYEPNSNIPNGTIEPLQFVSEDGNNSTIQHGKSKKLDLELRKDLDATTLKVFANGKQLKVDLNSTHADYQNINNFESRVVGSVTLSGISQDTTITYSVEEQTIDVQFVLHNYNYASSEQRTIFQKLKMADNSSLSQLATTNTAYKATYSQIIESKFNSVVDNGQFALAISGGDLVSGVYNFSDNGKQFAYKTDSNRQLFVDCITSLKNQFCLSVKDYKLLDNSFPRTITVNLDPTAINVVPDCELYTRGSTIFTIDPPYDQWFNASLTPNIEFALNKLQNIDYSNAQVYIWDTVVQPNADGTYTIDKAPIYYMNDKRLQNENAQDQVVYYSLYVKGINFASSSALTIINIQKDNVNVANFGALVDSGQDIDIYYQDDSIVAYQKSNQWATFSFDYTTEYGSGNSINNIDLSTVNLILKIKGSDKFEQYFKNYMPNSANVTENNGVYTLETYTEKITIQYRVGLVDEKKIQGETKYKYTFRITVTMMLGTQNSVVLE